MDQDPTDAEFNRTTARLLRREALRRAAEEVNTSFGPGLEDMLARISEESTDEAAERLAVAAPVKPADAKPAQSRPSKP